MLAMAAARCIPILVLALAACGLGVGGGNGTTPIAGANVPAEVLVGRARDDSPYSFAEIAVRDRRNLGLRRVADRSGQERHPRLHPDGNTVVFARERSPADPSSRELFVSSVDGAAPDQRLTQDTHTDDAPCWSPDGTAILFASDRSGDGGLHLIAPTGGAVSDLLGVGDGVDDAEPDWCRATGRIVWSRAGSGGRRELWLANGDGTGATALTDGGPGTGTTAGDRAPAFAPDGAQIVFVRRVAAGLATLCTVATSGGAVTPIATPQGDVDLPRWSTAGDQIFFGLAEPLQGRATLRLAAVPTTGGTPVLVWPDQRWQLTGIDFLPGLQAAPAAAAPQALDVAQAYVEMAAGTSMFGTRSLLTDADGSELAVTTETFENHEIAGINCRFDLPVANATDVLELRVRAVARVGRADGDTHLRMSIHNPVDERFDTVVERAVTDTQSHVMEFTTSSLRHVTRERQVRFTVIGEIGAGASSQLLVDQVELVVVARTGA